MASAKQTESLMNKDEITEGILYLLWEEENARDKPPITFLRLRSFLKLNGYSEGKSWRPLKELLMDMEENDLLEERHFDNGVVDYSIENTGMKLMREKDKSKLEKRWKLP